MARPRPFRSRPSLEVTPVAGTYARKKRDFDSQAPRKALGIVRPVISPDGKTIAFAALGDIYVMPVGGAPMNITHDAAYDSDPAWSPDGGQLVYCSDKAGGLLQLWLRDMKTRAASASSPIFPPSRFLRPSRPTASASPIWMWTACGGAPASPWWMWPRGTIIQVHASIFAPGAPTWSPDGKRIAVAMVAPYSTRYREGTNQILTMSSTGTPDSQRRQMVCAGAGPFHRQPRLERAGLVARRHPHGRDL